MALFRCDVFSEALQMFTTLNVTIPDGIKPEEKQELKVLYLLHGLSDNSSAWLRNTSIERYAADYGIAVVMPEVQRSFYADMEYGLKYFTYVSKELPQMVNKFFGLSTKRENSFIAGLSMGGYGAVKIGLACPEQFFACAGFSGALDIEKIAENKESVFEKELVAIIGNEGTIKQSDNLFYLAKECDKLPCDQKPKVFITCGTEDFLYTQNIKFRDYMNTLNYDFAYEEWAGEHEWGFWDKSIKLALKNFL